MNPGREDGSASDRPTVIVDDEREPDGSDHAVDVDRWAGLVADVLDDEGLSDREVEVHLHFVDESAIGDLNRDHMGVSGPTDVLAFPIDELRPGLVNEEPEEGVLGDLVLCPVVAERQGETAGHGTLAEIELLTTHGILHLLGYDHAEPEEHKEMFGLQDELLAAWRSSLG